jgi:DNA mismatch endonuclease (patch repair protein)
MSKRAAPSGRPVLRRGPGRIAAVRSRIMAAIRGKNTKPELVVRRALHAAGLRYRLHKSGLPGHPDLVFTRLKTVVFVHGCFWHKHDCPRFRWPKTRVKWWRTKLTNNEARDARVRTFLRAAGWHVEVIWECELRTPSRLARLTRKLLARRENA